MTEQPRHRPVDAELIERYVLDRASEEERSEVESLILADPEWAEALRREQLLAAGARRLGREQVRARLHDRAARDLPVRTPWVRVAAIAACVVIVVGVAVYRFLPSQQAATEPTTDAYKAPDIAANEAPAARLGDGKESKPDGTVRTEVSRSKPSEEKRFTTAYPSPVQAGGEAGQSGAQELKAAAPPTPDEGAAFWTEGTILDHRAGFERLRTDAEEKPKDEFLRNQQRVAREEVAAESAAAVAGQAVPGVFSISQRRFSEADRQSQIRSSQLSPPAVPTLVRVAGDSLQLILFFDPAVDDAVLKAARVDQIAPDSFVVTIGSRQLGYRIPLQQQSTKLR